MDSFKLFSRIVRKVRKHLLSSEEAQGPGSREIEKTAIQSKTIVKEESTVKSQMTQLQSPIKSQMTQIQSVTRSPDGNKLSTGRSPDSRSAVGASAIEKVVPSVCESVVTQKPTCSDDVTSDRSTSSLNRIRMLSERAVRKVKTFVSRPIKDATLQLFVSKIEAKKQAEESGKISAREMKLGDDPFPKPRPRSSKSAEYGAQDFARTPDMLDLKSVAQQSKCSKYGSLPSGCQLVLGNNNNNGKLLIDGNPFWMEQRKPTEADLEDSGTDDELQMSADVALDVYEGKVKLVNMPSIPVVLDPMNELSELQRRDKLFYCRDVLFGNSVRSMINLYDTSMKASHITRRSSGGRVTFEEPSVRQSYRKNGVFNVVKEPFAPQCRKKVSRKSRKRKKQDTNSKKDASAKIETRSKMSTEKRNETSMTNKAVVETSRHESKHGKVKLEVK